MRDKLFYLGKEWKEKIEIKANLNERLLKYIFLNIYIKIIYIFRLLRKKSRNLRVNNVRDLTKMRIKFIISRLY